MKNVSEGGLAIKLVDPVRAQRSRCGGVRSFQASSPRRLVQERTSCGAIHLCWGCASCTSKNTRQVRFGALARFVRVPTSFSRIGGTHLLIKNCNSSSLELRWYRFSLSWRRDRNYFDSCAGGDAVGGVVCTERFSPRRRGRQDTGSPRVPRCTLHHAPTVRPPGRIIVDIPMATRTLGS